MKIKLIMQHKHKQENGRTNVFPTVRMCLHQPEKNRADPDRSDRTWLPCAYKIYMDTKYICMCICVLVAQSCPTLCDPMDCSLPGSSVHGILQQEDWCGLPFPPPRDLPDPGTEPTSTALAGGFFTTELQRNFSSRPGWSH